MKLTESEWTVMNAVWELTPASARDVHERLEPQTEWAYSTVKTILSRLDEKGALVARRRTNRLVFEPKLTRAQARKHAVRTLVDAAFDSSAFALAQYLLAHSSISACDREQLAGMLAEGKR